MRHYFLFIIIIMRVSLDIEYVLIIGRSLSGGIETEWLLS